jgi:uncharacterized coiled-coil protein SlyX
MFERLFGSSPKKPSTPNLYDTINALCNAILDLPLEQFSDAIDDFAHKCLDPGFKVYGDIIFAVLASIATKELDAFNRSRLPTVPISPPDFSKELSQDEWFTRQITVLLGRLTEQETDLTHRILQHRVDLIVFTQERLKAKESTRKLLCPPTPTTELPDDIMQLLTNLQDCAQIRNPAELDKTLQRITQAPVAPLPTSHSSALHLKCEQIRTDKTLGAAHTWLVQTLAPINETLSSDRSNMKKLEDDLTLRTNRLKTYQARGDASMAAPEPSSLVQNPTSLTRQCSAPAVL